MQFKTYGCNGCLFFVFIFFLLAFLVKFWALFFIIFLIMLNAGNLERIKKLFSKITTREKEYKSKPGKIYKQCNYCQSKAERHALVCPKCNRPFEG